MTTLERTGASCGALVFILLSACGGNVNLGGKGSPPGSGESGGAPPVQTDPDPSASEPITTLDDDFSLGTLAVAGDYLYFSGVGAKGGGELHRCRKTDCEATRELLTSVSGTIGSLQVFGERLGVTNYAAGSFWLGSYALPAASDQRIAIADLPTRVPIASQFFGSFVYFALGVDSGIYRCALPDCPSGPERIGSAHAATGQVSLSVDGELVFWTDRSFIYRAADAGHESARALLPDAELTEAPAGAGAPENGLSASVEAMTAGDGALYAVLKDAETGAPCEPYCAQRIVRWPSSGGPSEVLFSKEAMLGAIFLFGEELVWVALDQPANYTATLSTCRVEDCEATHRELGKVMPGVLAVVADDRDLYFLKAGAIVEDESRGAHVPEHQIRRASRLPPP
jgi:hypothetical protein